MLIYSAGSQQDIHPMAWYFTTEMTTYIRGDTVSWTPNQDYFNRLVEKLVRGKLNDYMYVCKGCITRSKSFHNYNCSNNYEYIISPFLQCLTYVCLGLQPFNLNTSICDWHFSEFSSCMNFALYCCCVELMALPLPDKDVARQLIEAIYAKYAIYMNY